MKVIGRHRRRHHHHHHHHHPKYQWIGSEQNLQEALFVLCTRYIFFFEPILGR